MPAKRGNVLTQLLCVFKSKKLPGEDIVTLADKVVRDYIYSKNKYIRQKYRKNYRLPYWGAALIFTSLVLSLVIFNLL